MKQFEKVNLICDYDGHINGTPISFENKLDPSYKYLQQFFWQNFNWKARSSTIIPRRSFIKTSRNFCSKESLRFRPGFSTVTLLKSIFGGQSKASVSLTLVSFILFWDFSMFCQIFLLPQVKRWPIITYKYDIYKLPHELPNHLRPRILGN